MELLFFSNPASWQSGIYYIIRLAIYRGKPDVSRQFKMSGGRY